MFKILFIRVYKPTFSTFAVADLPSFSSIHGKLGTYISRTVGWIKESKKELCCQGEVKTVNLGLSTT